MINASVMLNISSNEGKNRINIKDTIDDFIH